MFSSNTSQVSSDALFIEDVMSTFLYTGSSSVGPTISNGIDLATEGGLVWLKTRSAATGHVLFDSARGMSGSVDKFLQTQNTDAEVGSINYITPSTTGFSLLPGVGGMSADATNYVSWTFRKAPKFFDVVTWTGDGVAGRQIAHNLGAAPGAIIVKCTSIARDWAVWQNTLSDGTYLKLNTTDSVITNTSFQVFGDSSGQTSTYFTVGKSGAGVNGLTNASGDTYVAYLFAHNAGGFGLTGTDNVISCGSYTGNGSATGPTVTLGYEPQFVMFKRTDTTSNWTMVDTMRGLPIGADATLLYANLSNAEGTNTIANLTATGFQLNTTFPAVNASGGTYIYIAIRRGPMKTPTSGTSVFATQATAGATDGTPSMNRYTSNFPVDFMMEGARAGSSTNAYARDRLRGGTISSITSSTAAEATTDTFKFDDMDGLYLSTTNSANSNRNAWMFRRAPGFFDEVCYTGTGVARTVAHNLTVAPELMILKRRSGAADWPVYHIAMGSTKYTFLDGSTELTSSAYWNDTAPTSSVFTVGTNYRVNNSGDTYVAYLFASAPGVSKVGSYTGTGTTQQINCGFSTGARFVLIHRIDSGDNDWYVWDSARGIVAGNDPYLLLNSTAAEVTTTDYVDTFSSGFEISSTAPAAINASGGTFIYLAIA